MEADGRRMCELLVGLGEVDLVGMEELDGGRLEVMIRSRGPRPVCEGCGGRVWSRVTAWWVWSTCRRLVVRCGCGGANAAGLALTQGMVWGLLRNRMCLWRRSGAC